MKNTMIISFNLLIYILKITNYEPVRKIDISFYFKQKQLLKYFSCDQMYAYAIIYNIYTNKHIIFVKLSELSLGKEGGQN